MATLTIKLADTLTTTSSFANASDVTASLDSTNLTFDPASGQLKNGSVVYGTLTISGGAVTFTATANAPEATYKFENSGAVSTPLVFSTVDAHLMTSAFTLDTTDVSDLTKVITGSGADVINASNYTDLVSITGNAGDDTITATAAAGLFVNTGDGDDALTIKAAAADVTMSNAVTLGAGNDSIVVGTTADTKFIEASVLGLAGDDTITAAGLANITVTGGTGADTFVQKDTTATLNVTDYKYADGDTVKIAATDFTGVALAKADGKLTGTKVDVQTAVSGNVYQATVVDSESTAVTRDYWTAKNNVSSVAMDATNLTDSYVFDASGAGKATITLGAVGAAATVTAATTSTTLTAGKASGTVDVEGWDATNTTKDILNLTADLSIDKSTGDVVSAGTTLKKVLTYDTAGNTAQYLKYTENGNATAVKTLAYVGSADAANVVLDATHTNYDKYVNDGVAANAIDAHNLTKAMTFRLNNDAEVGKYTGVYKVIGSKGGGTYVGAGSTDTATTFDLSNATLSSQVWGGGVSAGVNVTFNTDDKESDVVWFGTTDGDVTISNFGAGFGTSNDVVYLYDVVDAGNADYYAAAANDDAAYKVQVDDDATVTIKAIAGAVDDTKGIQLRVKNSAGIISNVALGTSDNDSEIVTTAAANYVIGKGSNANETTVSLTGTKANETVVVRLANDLAGQTTTYTNVGKADLTGLKDDATVDLVGAGAVTGMGSALKAGGKTVNVWGGSAEADDITFSRVNKATNTVWFGTADGSDTVENFTTNATQKNSIRFYDQTLKQIVTNYEYVGGTSGTFTNVNDATNVLTLNNLTNNASATYGIIDSTGLATNAVVANGTAKLSYASTAKLYMGANTELDVNGATGASIRLTNDGDTYYSGITKVDASKVTAGVAELVGSGKDDTILIGGYGSNAFWGGGKTSDDMQGKAGVVDTFWFDAGDGTDTASAGVDKNDVVKLYSTTSASDVVITLNSDNNGFVVTKVNDTEDSLTVTDTKLAALKGGLTFELGSTQYTYDATSGGLKAK